MAGYDALLVQVHTEELAHAAAYVAVAGAVETVAAYAVYLIIFVGKCVHICLCGHGLVEGGVEYSYLRHVGQNGCNGVDACHIGGIVEGRYVVAFAYFCLYGIVDEHALAEFLAAVYHTVTYSVDFIVALDATFLGVGKVGENGLYGFVVVDETELHNFFGAVGTLELEEAVGEAYFLYAAFGHSVGLATLKVDELILHRATARV